MDLCFVISKIWELSKEEDLNYEAKQKIRNDVFSYFSLFVHQLSSCQTIPFSEKMEVINHSKKIAPDLHFKNGLKQKMVSFLYHRLPFIYMAYHIFHTKTFQNYRKRHD